jgi:hypothetical protein
MREDIIDCRNPHPSHDRTGAGFNYEELSFPELEKEITDLVDEGFLLYLEASNTNRRYDDARWYLNPDDERVKRLVSVGMILVYGKKE